MQKADKKTQREAQDLISKLENGDSILSEDLVEKEGDTEKQQERGQNTKVLRVKKNEKKITAEDLFKQTNDGGVNIKNVEKSKTKTDSKDWELMKGLDLNQLKKKEIIKEASILNKRNKSEAILEYGESSEDEEEILEVNALDGEENANELLLEKEKEEDEDTEKNGEREMMMTGWGEWAGGGFDFEQEQRKKKLKLQAKRKERLARAVKQRKDGGLRHVKINTKRIKDTTGIYLQDIPFEFENKSQVNFIMSQPVGEEWNGQLQYKRNIRPKMKTQAGKVIRPASDKTKQYKLSHF
jgi:U3 small nucleolar RNA-associated protein 14